MSSKMLAHPRIAVAPRTPQLTCPTARGLVEATAIEVRAIRVLAQGTISFRARRAIEQCDPALCSTICTRHVYAPLLASFDENASRPPSAPCSTRPRCVQVACPAPYPTAPRKGEETRPCFYGPLRNLRNSVSDEGSWGRGRQRLGRDVATMAASGAHLGHCALCCIYVPE